MGKVFLLSVRATPSGEFKLYKQSSRIHVSIKVHLECDDSKRKELSYSVYNVGKTVMNNQNIMRLN